MVLNNLRALLNKLKKNTHWQWWKFNIRLEWVILVTVRLFLNFDPFGSSFQTRTRPRRNSAHHCICVKAMWAEKWAKKSTFPFFSFFKQSNGWMCRSWNIWLPECLNGSCCGWKTQQDLWPSKDFDILTVELTWAVYFLPITCMKPPRQMCIDCTYV